MNTVYEIINYSEDITIIEDSGVRMFLIKGQEADMLVDTGFGDIDIREILDSLTDRDVFVVNTHADGDHTGNNGSFDQIYMHPSDFDRYSEKNDTSALRPVNDGDIIDLGISKWEVILTPGHTPGSIMLLDRENRILISGDTIQYGPIFMFGRGRNMPAFIWSLRRLKDVYFDTFDTILPSHGDIEPDKKIIDELIDGATAILNGEIEKEEMTDRPFPTYLYRTGRVSFYYGNK